MVGYIIGGLLLWVIVAVVVAVVKFDGAFDIYEGEE